ncbi:uncharacterized protein LOC133303256 [Gastrolobium bilobum]|uniref:uncharacterized protein LOC133303256 n=1 Tax=Gastrolobium bilobum TaxID=150636 RepID=UPI002AB1EFD2|nr:uncharacterized protein LOC133303256 [Gastrolobium bilobum]
MADNTRIRDLAHRLDALEQQNHRLDLLEQQLRSAELVALEHKNKGFSTAIGCFGTTKPSIRSTRTTAAFCRIGILGSGPSFKSYTNNTDLVTFCPLKLTFPRFNSGDPTSWFFWVDRYCQYYRISEKERLLIVAFHLDDLAACWFRGLSDEGLLPTWAAFVTVLHRRFGPSEFDEPIGTLAKLQQQGSVAEYQSAFEAAVSKVPGLSATMKRGLFISGLKSRIRRLVLPQRPGDWHEALALAKVFEDHLSDEKSIRPWMAKPPFSPSYNSQFPSSSHTKPFQPLALPNPNSTKPIPAITIRRLSQAEMQVKRDKGLCFNCDEKFVYAHKCKARASLLYLEGLEEDEPPDTGDPVPETNAHIEEIEEIPEISFNALFGTYSSKSFRLLGIVMGQSVQILIDGGSTHNFITPRVATHLHLTLISIPPFNVQVGNGDSLTYSAMCQSVPLDIQGHRFSVDLFVLELQGADMVFGVQWLSTLGPIVTDYQKLTMGFVFQGVHVVLQGEQQIAVSLITSSQLHKLVAQKSLESCIMCLFAMAAPPTSASPKQNDCEQNPEVQTLLDQYRDVFAAPNSLPPDRPNNHCIPLIPDGKPVQVRPYRYPHFQKNEIEKLVVKMLQNGVIRPSQSAFSSPEHISHLNQVLHILWIHTLFAKLSKCLFAQPSIQFLGHIISGNGVAPDPSKSKAILEWPIPTSATPVRAFQGLSGYYRRFIRHYACIGAPVTDLLTKEGFSWSSAAEEAFTKLKKSLTTAPILALPNFKEPFVVEIDASGIGVGAVLLQNNHPIAFYSRKLAPTMHTKSTYIREMFAITSAMAKWRQYLLGVPFTIRTDHKSLHNLMNQVVQTSEQ